jgi:predicted NBD/HSP70 family sugar kinase
MKGVAVVKRFLKKGKTYKDFRKAWFHTKGFGIETKMYSMINIFNPREILVIGMMDIGSQEELESALAIDVDERLENPLDDIIETEIERNFYSLVSMDDFSSDGEIEYKDASVDGIKTNFVDLESNMKLIAKAIMEASADRDKRKGDKVSD